MENFFYNDNFYSSFDEFLDYNDISEESLDEIGNDETFECYRSSLEKIFNLDIDFVVNAILNKTDRFSDRFPEDDDRVFDDISKAVRASVDIDKLNGLLPELYYPTNEKFVITKQDIVEYLKSNP